MKKNLIRAENKNILNIRIFSSFTFELKSASFLDIQGLPYLCQHCINLGTIVITSGKEDIFLHCILVMFAHWHDLLLL